MRLIQSVIILTACLFAAIPSPCKADEIDLPIVSKGDLQFNVDTYSFRGEWSGFEEIAIGIPVTQLIFKETQGVYVTTYTPVLRFFDHNGKEVKKIEGERRVQFATESATRDSTRSVNDVARFQLAPGRYNGWLEISTSEGGKGRAEFAVEVPRFQAGHLSLSDPFFIRSIDPPDPGGAPDRFQKFGHILIPMPSRVVSAGAPIRFYFQISEIGQLQHEVTFKILDRFGNAVFSDVRDFGPYRDSARFIEGIPVRNLPAGAYALRISVTAGDQIAVTERHFELGGPAPVVSPAFAERQNYLRMLIEKDADESVVRKFDALSVDDRAHFGYGYWREHDPLLANTYVGLLTGLGRHEVRMPILHALNHERTLKKRVDKTFGERLSEPDTQAVRLAREKLDIVLDLDKQDPYALTGYALLALEAGFLSEGEVYAKKALESIPDLADAQNAVGLSKIGRSDWDEAARRFETAASNAPGWGTPRLNSDLAAFLSGKGNATDELDRIQKAATYDLTHPDVYYIAGRLLERLSRLEESAAAYARQVSVNPHHARARFDLGRVMFKLGRVDTATVIWRELMDARPEFRRSCVTPLLDAYLRSGETGKAQALVGEELRVMAPETRARAEDIGLVAGPKEYSAYEQLDEEERPKFIRAFWQKRDPTPATPGNERLVEHHRRVVYALQNFPSAKKGWDRRGDVYIRYGEPAHISKHNDIRFETDPRVVRVRDRLSMTLSSEAREEIIARAGRMRTSARDQVIEGEYGQQVDSQDFESIDFEMNPNRSFFVGEQDNSNSYVRGTEETSYRGRMREKPILGIPLFPVDGGTPWEYWIYPDVAGGIEVVFTALTPKGDYDYPEVSRGRKLARFNEKLWDERRPEIVVKRASSKEPDRYLPPGEALDFHFAVADFKGKGDRSRLEVYYGVPVLNLGQFDEEVIVERGVALFDSKWTPVYRNTVPMGVGASEEDVEAGTLAIDEIALQLPPGRYYLGVQVNHPATNRRNGYTQELIVDDYNIEGLGLSDIEIAGRVEVDDSIPDKGGLKVLPMPSRTFKQGQPVVIYYELYGLTRDAFGQTRHRVDYRIKPRTGKLSAVRVLRALGRLVEIEEKAIVTISYEQTGTDPDEHNYLEIDPGDSKEGIYELTVTVTDLTSEQTAEKSTTFLIGE